MALVALATPLLYAGLIAFQLGAYRGAQWWLADIITLRRDFYQAILTERGEAPKTLVVGGSGTLFGVDGGAIEKATGRTTLNFGLHAGLDIDMLMAPATPFIGRGDIVLMPLEFEQYSRPTVTDLSAESFLAFLYPYAGALVPERLPRLIVGAQPISILEGVGDRIIDLLTARPPGRHDLAALKADWQQIRDQGLPAGSDHTPYDYSSMNAHGDKEVLADTPKDAIDKLRQQATPAQSLITPYTSDALASWQAALAARGARLALTWPILIEDDQGTLTTAEYWHRIIALAKAADEAGAPLHCDPIAAIVPVAYRYDTPYHANKKGALIYSAGLAACLAGPEPKLFDWRSADPVALAAAAAARLAALKVPSAPFVFGYERNIAILAGLHAAIEAAHNESGRYPDQLPPFDPMLDLKVDGDAAFMPWYRTDGSDYKLLAEDPHDCFAVSVGWPTLIDPNHPVDGGCAYGYWTAGAAKW